MGCGPIFVLSKFLWQCPQRAVFHRPPPPTPCTDGTHGLDIYSCCNQVGHTEIASYGKETKSYCSLGGSKFNSRTPSVDWMLIKLCIFLMVSIKVNYPSKTWFVMSYVQVARWGERGELRPWSEHQLTPLKNKKRRRKIARASNQKAKDVSVIQCGRSLDIIRLASKTCGRNKRNFTMELTWKIWTVQTERMLSSHIWDVAKIFFGRIRTHLVGWGWEQFKMNERSPHVWDVAKFYSVGSELIW